MLIKVFPYNLGSEGARALAQGLGALRIRPDGRYVPRQAHRIINWGNSHQPQWHRPNLTVLNRWDKVAVAINKIRAFQKLQEEGVSIPQFALNREGANALFADNGIVVCRTVVNGRSGNGIVIARTPQELVDAPLYTRHARHRHEYRIHVVRGQMIDYAQKKKRREGDEANLLVRSHDNGWVFCREGVVVPDVVRDQAVAAIAALGLDFGAVDVGHRVGDNRALVFEVNTAPGFEAGSTTANNYIEALRNACLG